MSESWWLASLMKRMLGMEKQASSMSSRLALQLTPKLFCGNPAMRGYAEVSQSDPYGLMAGPHGVDFALDRTTGRYVLVVADNENFAIRKFWLETPTSASERESQLKSQTLYLSQIPESR
jgi:hypothetical protein